MHSPDCASISCALAFIFVCVVYCLSLVSLLFRRPWLQSYERLERGKHVTSKAASPHAEGPRAML